MDPTTLKYTPTHEWVHLEGDVATLGISKFAVDQLTDLIVIELPKVGAKLTQGKPFGEVESVKAVSDLYAPVGGEVDRGQRRRRQRTSRSSPKTPILKAGSSRFGSPTSRRSPPSSITTLTRPRWPTRPTEFPENDGAGSTIRTRSGADSPLAVSRFLPTMYSASAPITVILTPPPPFRPRLRRRPRPRGRPGPNHGLYREYPGRRAGHARRDRARTRSISCST